jgi:hypothetical protein
VLAVKLVFGVHV